MLAWEPMAALESQVFECKRPRGGRRHIARKRAGQDAILRAHADAAGHGGVPISERSRVSAAQCSCEMRCGVTAMYCETNRSEHSSK